MIRQTHKSMKNTRIAIIGCGNLGLSILNGLLNNPEVTNSNITVTKRNLSTLKHLEQTNITITTDNAKAIKEARLVILALKPYTILGFLKEHKDLFNSEHILVSLATGITLEQLSKEIDASATVYRAMPNTAAGVSTSMTCICTNSKDHLKTEMVTNSFNSIGNTITIDESLMDAATVLGACGIAYVLRFIRGMVQGGIQIGFDSKTASEIVNHTVKGAAQLLIEGGQHPEYEIDKVTTPKGCTIAGLNEMEHNGFSSALIKGIVTSRDAIDN